MKAFESICSKSHLCLNCKNQYPSCVSRIKFGDGLGYDNICGCTSFVEDIEGEIPFLEIEMEENDFNKIYED